MKTRLMLPFLLFATAACYAQLPATELEGSWEYISRRMVYADTVVTEDLFAGPSYKILNSTHFAFGRQTIADGEAQNDVFAGGGRYTVVDSVYTETIEYHSTAGLVGQKVVFKSRIEGELWFQTGQLGDFYLEEVLRRIR